MIAPVQTSKPFRPARLVERPIVNVIPNLLTIAAIEGERIRRM